jgi:hypothetical protein
MNCKCAAILSVLAGALALVASAFGFWTVYPDGVTIHEAGVAEGYVLFGAQDGNVYLVDVDGAVVHTWSVPCGWQGPQRALANGHVLTGSCGSLVELDWVGTVVWEFIPPAGAEIHHDWERLPNGNTLILCRQTIGDPSISDVDIVEDFILEVSPVGDIVWEWHEADHFVEFGFSQERIDTIYDRGGDWSHATSVSVVPDNTSHSDPRFRPGNIIIGLRHQNTLAIIDRVTNAIVWAQTGSVVGPHTAHMISDDLSGGGNILVLDSGFGEDWSGFANRGSSQVVEIDPVTGSFSYTYNDRSSGLVRGTFFSHVDGGAQRLSNGNTLINEASFGRIFEVLDSGQIVWEYIVPFWNVANNNATYRAYKVPLDWAGPHFVPDLPVSRDDDSDPVQAGDNLDYTITSDEF